MELLIPGLLLVALMVWASTKIKKQAADAFEAEFIETEKYSMQKPDGFLHVIGDPEHELKSYSKDFGKGDNTGIRQATIEIDLFPGSDLRSVRNAITNDAASSEVTTETATAFELNTEETANEIPVKAFYKIVAAEEQVYRLRFAVLPEYVDEYLGRVEEAFGSFTTKTN
ncbi:MAG TPA: hypothetical protein VMZ26_08305 [Pyrinomonadaceae bacterium]|nr:hypothetical protein [Pyrinomonadaceae bacterium]